MGRVAEDLHGAAAAGGAGGSRYARGADGGDDGRLQTGVADPLEIVIIDAVPGHHVVCRRRAVHAKHHSIAAVVGDDIARSDGIGSSLLLEPHATALVRQRHLRGGLDTDAVVRHHVIHGPRRSDHNAWPIVSGYDVAFARVAGVTDGVVVGATFEDNPGRGVGLCARPHTADPVGRQDVVIRSADASDSHADGERVDFVGVDGVIVSTVQDGHTLPGVIDARRPGQALDDVTLHDVVMGPCAVHGYG